MTYAIGVDLGGTKLHVGVVDQAGLIQDRRLVPTDVQGGPKAIMKQIVGSIQELCAKRAQKPLAIGVGLPGQVDPINGHVISAPNLFWTDVSIRKELERDLGLPVSITNDVRAATWGEWQVGAGKGIQDLVCIFVGTGIGGGIVSHGQIIEGASNSAGEIGHTVIQMGGRLCNCGQKGCFEAYASGWSITKMAKELIVQQDLKSGQAILALAEGVLEKVTTRQVATASKNGDPLAKQIVDGVIEALIAGSVNIVNTLNPKRLIFGGGVINGMPELIGPVQEGIKLHALASATKGLEVTLAGLGSDAGVIGAAIFGRNYLL